MTSIKTAIAALTLTTLAGTTIAQTTISGDVTVPPGGTLLIEDNTTFTGTLTIGAGAQVVMGARWEILFADGATLTVNGTATEPVTFLRLNGDWNGVRMLTGSTGTMNHAVFNDIYDVAVEVDDAVLTMNGCSVFDDGHTLFFGGIRNAVQANTGAELTMDQCIIGPMRGHNGSSGGTGGTGTNGVAFIAIDATGADLLHITNSVFIGLEGGSGGAGGQGGQGSTGADAPDAILFNGIQGDPGGTGGTGGIGGAGGYTQIFRISNTQETVIAQNIVELPQGGRGGTGGRGGKGGTGGQGGDGAGGVFGNGGAGGKGGTGGRGGVGGRGGPTGELEVFRISNPGTSPKIANNTIINATARTGGAAGSAGAGGNGGSGGAGGGAGIGGSTGSTGATGTTGPGGTTGSPGTPGTGEGLVTIGFDSSGFSAIINNNIMTFTGPGAKFAFVSTDSGIIDASYNNVVNVNTMTIGPVIGGLTIITTPPLFIDPGAGDYSPAPMSPVIDAGANGAVPASITTDFAGGLRFMDDPDTADTGIGSGALVDMGAFELQVETPDCLADVNGDGMVTPTDFTAWINAFNNNLPGCDQNGDGSCTPTDFTAWIANFNAGCD